MSRRIVPVVIDDTRVPLLFNFAAEVEMARRLGGLDKLLDALRRQTPEQKEIEAEILKSVPEAERKAEGPMTEDALLEFLPFWVACLGRQGQLYEGKRDGLVTEDWVSLHMSPGETEAVLYACYLAMGRGMETQHEMKGGETRDVVQETLEKNARGGAI